MGSFSAWLGDSGMTAPSASVRAALAWRRISHKKTLVAFKTPANVTLDAQAVRIESDSSASTPTSEAGKAGSRKIVIFGIRGHQVYDDTDMKEGYRCVINAEEYRCQSVLLTIGEIQGLFEAV